MKKNLALFLCFMLAPSLVYAKAVITGLTWETAPRGEVKNVSSVYSEITEFTVQGLNFDKLRSVVTLNNNSEKRELGLVLRYAFRLQLKNNDTNETFWEVPYYVEELRVPVVKAGVTKDAKIISLKLKEQLKRLSNTGYSPIAIKLEVMLSPRKGVSEDARIAESILPLKYEPAPVKAHTLNLNNIKKVLKKSEKSVSDNSAQSANAMVKNADNAAKAKKSK